MIIASPFLTFSPNILYMTKGQKQNSPMKNHKLLQTYETGESVLPKYENSIGLEAIVLAGR